MKKDYSKKEESYRKRIRRVLATGCVGTTLEVGVVKRDGVVTIYDEFRNNKKKKKLDIAMIKQKVKKYIRKPYYWPSLYQRDKKREAEKKIIAEANEAISIYESGKKSKANLERYNDVMMRIYKRYGESEDFNEQCAMLAIIKNSSNRFDERISRAFWGMSNQREKEEREFVEGFQDKFVGDISHHLRSLPLPTRWSCGTCQPADEMIWESL